MASQAVVSLVAESVELAAQELTKVKRTVAGHDKSIAAIQELVFSMEKKRDEEVAKLAQAQRADNQGLLREARPRPSTAPHADHASVHQHPLTRAP